MVGISTIVGGALAIGGSLISSGSSNSNSRRAAETSTQNNAANTALARESRDLALQRLDPFAGNGIAAGNQINALLGLGGSQVQGGPARAEFPAPNALSQFEGYPSGAGAPYGLGDTPGLRYGGGRPNFTPDNPGVYRQPNALSQFNSGPTANMGPQTGQTAQQAAENGFDIFRNSTGYQFRLGEGLDAVNSGYAGSGLLQSGAALRGITEYGQNFASNEFGNYLNALGSQQAVGAGAASASAGVSQNFAGTVISGNNANTQNQINAQLGQQNGFANALGALGGGILGFGR
jgi:hypothetical protein